MNKQIIKDITIFVIITVIAGLSLATVYSFTSTPIALQNEQVIKNSYKSVFSNGDSFVNDKKIDKLVNDFASNDDYSKNGIIINEVLVASDKQKELLGHIIKVTSKEGYGGDITLVVGIDNSDQITGIEILKIDETVGLGMNAKNDSFKSQYYNKEVDYFNITKTGKQDENEIDALSGATITSNAFNNAINGALKINSLIKEME